MGLSTPDSAKILTAISGGDGPDITDDFHSNVPKYAEENIAIALDEYIAADNINLDSIFVKEAYESNQWNGSTYALPVSNNVMALYYNKDILEAAGYTEIPGTMEELLEMCADLTIVENGEVVQFGYPFMTQYLHQMIYATGYDFGTADAVDITNDGVRTALKTIVDVVDTYGDAVTNYITSSKALVYSDQDPFFLGQDVMRFDGNWIYTMGAKAGVNVGVAMIPGFADQGGKTFTTVSNSNFYIPSTAKNKDGAWDFMKFITMGDGAKMFTISTGNQPAMKTLMDDQDVAAVFDEEGIVLKIMKESVLNYFPQMKDSSAYGTALESALDGAILGDSIEDIMAELQTVQDAN